MPGQLSSKIADPTLSFSCSYYYYFPAISALVVAVFFPSGKSRRSKGTAAAGKDLAENVEKSKPDIKRE